MGRTYIVVYLTKEGQLCSFASKSLHYALNAQQHLEYTIGLVCKIATEEKI